MKRLYIVSLAICFVAMMGFASAQSVSDFSFNIIADEVEYALTYNCEMYNESASWYRTNMTINETLKFTGFEWASEDKHIYLPDLQGTFDEFPKLEPGEVKESSTGGYQLGVPTPEWSNGSYLLEDHQLSIEFHYYLLAVGLAVGNFDFYTDIINSEGGTGAFYEWFLAPSDTTVSSNSSYWGYHQLWEYEDVESFRIDAIYSKFDGVLTEFYFYDYIEERFEVELSLSRPETTGGAIMGPTTINIVGLSGSAFVMVLVILVVKPPSKDIAPSSP